MLYTHNEWLSIFDSICIKLLNLGIHMEKIHLCMTQWLLQNYKILWVGSQIFAWLIIVLIKINIKTSVLCPRKIKKYLMIVYS